MSRQHEEWRRLRAAVDTFRGTLAFMVAPEIVRRYITDGVKHDVSGVRAMIDRRQSRWTST